jgi:dipeptidyl-peptidase-4
LTRFLYSCNADGGVSQLAVHAGSGVSESKLSLEEQLRRERLRERGLGITRYFWAKDVPTLLVPDSNALYVSNSGQPVRAVATSAKAAGPILDPVLSPDGTLVAYVQAGDIHVASTQPGSEGAPPHQVTSGATCNVTCGLADYIAQEELHCSMGLWWSPHGRAIAFCEVDTSAVQRYRIPHFEADPGAEEVHAYPFAGTNNATVRLGVARSADWTDSSQVVWTDIVCGPGQPWEYLCRVTWDGDDVLIVQVMDRPQKQLATLRVHAVGDGATVATIHSEKASTWINLCDDHKALSVLEPGCVLLSAEHTGQRHLYVVYGGGDLIAVTEGATWGVDAVAGIDIASRRVFFTATAHSPLERHLYVAPIPPAASGTAEVAAPTRLTQEAGMHTVVMDATCTRFVDTHDALDKAPTVTLRSAVDGAALCVLFAPQAPMPHRALRLGLTPPLPIELLAADGVTPLHGVLYLPPPGARPPPLVVHVYGGPHVQMVTRGWSQTVDMRSQLLRSRGFAVLKLDSRGSARRGRAFEDVLHLAMGSHELDDQAAAVKQLASRPGIDVDTTRVAIFGWSYGGYLSALAALKLPNVFSCAVVGAPVTSWDGYDTAYTERYMGTFAAEKDAYERSSCLNAALWAPQPSPMLLIHGGLDENVHFRHTARLVAQLNRRRVPHQLMLFPQERHLPRDMDGRAYTEARVLAFLTEHLMRP